MWRQFVAQTAKTRPVCCRKVLAKLDQFTRQLVDLLLLAKNGLVQLVQKVVGKRGFDLERRQALFSGVRVFHSTIKHQIAHARYHRAMLPRCLQRQGCRRATAQDITMTDPAPLP
jgi:hypothetical protein